MNYKTVQLKEEVYKELKRMKNQEEWESFSSTIQFLLAFYYKEERMAEVKA